MSVKITPRQLNEKRNDSDVFNISIIAGLLNVLNTKLTYTQVWENSSIGTHTVTVPFFYEFGTSNTERFLQDNYLMFGDMCDLPKVIGNFDMFPRGSIKYNGSSIESSNITNRFVLGNYTRKDENGKLESYVSFLYSIPLTLNFDIKIKIDTLVTAFKIESAIREFFYKNVTFYSMYRGMRIGCRAGFPESQSLTKTISYKMGGGQENEISLEFSIVVETYQPVFDPTTEMKASNKITGFAYDAKIKNAEKSIGWIAPIFDYSGLLIPSGSKLDIAWNYIKDIGDMRTVNIDVYHSDHTKEHIATVYNQMSYIWEIPEGFSGFPSIEYSIINKDDCFVHRQPVLKIIPDPTTKLIKPENVIVVDKGFIITEKERDTLSVIIYTPDRAGDLDEKTVTLNILNNQVNTENPLLFEPFVYSGNIPHKVVDIKISDALDPSLEYVIESVTIV